MAFEIPHHKDVYIYAKAITKPTNFYHMEIAKHTLSAFVFFDLKTKEKTAVIDD